MLRTALSGHGEMMEGQREAQRSQDFIQNGGPGKAGGWRLN